MEALYVLIEYIYSLGTYTSRFAKGSHVSPHYTHERLGHGGVQIP